MKLVQTIAMMALVLALGVMPAAARATAGTDDAAPVVDGDVTEATINGVQVLVKRVPGAELVASHLYIRGGSRNWGKADAGIESLSLQVAASGGAGGLDKIAFNQKLAALGSTLGADTGKDWSSLQGKSLLRNFDASFALMADAFLRPALPATELELARTQAVIMLKREQEQPEGRLGILVNDTLYAGHPYANRPQGTVESVSALTGAQVQAHLAKLREGSRLLLVVVGDVDAAHVFELARAAFGGLPRGSHVDAAYPRPRFSQSHLVTEKRELPTNYLQGWFTIPAPGESGYAAARVAMSFLWDQMFKEVRTKRNLSYAPGAAAVANQGSAMGLIAVSAVDPTTTYKVMLDVLRNLQATPMTAAELAGAKSTYLTNLLARSETTDGQADLLAQWQLQAGDWRQSRSFMDQVRTVSAADVQAFARRDFVHLQTVMLGDPAKLDPALATSL